jgi:lysophospholipase L1-like esterase
MPYPVSAARGGLGQGGAAFVGALDAIPNITAAYGMRRLLSTYTGNLLKIRRSSDDTEQDIGYTSTGALDTAAIASFIGGGNGFVKTWYDQKGSANATQATTASQPQYVASAVNSKPGISWSGAVSGMGLTTPSYAHFPSKRGALSVAYQNARTINQVTIAATFNGAGSNFLWYSNAQAAGTPFKYYDGSQHNQTSLDTNRVVTETLNRTGDTSLALYKNGNIVETITVGDLQPATLALVIGNITAGGGSFQGYLFELVEFSAALSSGNIRTIDDSRSSVYSASQVLNIACDGDSLTQGGGGASPYPTQLAASFPMSKITNFGQGGDTLNNMAANVVATVDAVFDATRISACCAWGGTNDIFFGDSAATAISDYASYCTARRAAGWKVVAFTILPRSDTGVPGAFETSRQTFNTSIRANWTTYADALADVAANTTIGDAGDELDTTYYQSDKVHLTTAGQAVVTGIVSTAIMTIG